MRDNLGFIRDFARKGRFTTGEGNAPFTSSEPFDEDEIDEGRGLAILAYVPFFCFIPYIQGKNTNRFAFEHGKQGVLLFLLEVIVLLCALFWKAALFLAAVVAIVGIVYAIQGRFLKIPWIGSFAEELGDFRSDNEER